MGQVPLDYGVLELDSRLAQEFGVASWFTCGKGFSQPRFRIPKVFGELAHGYFAVVQIVQLFGGYKFVDSAHVEDCNLESGSLGLGGLWAVLWGRFVGRFVENFCGRRRGLTANFMPPELQNGVRRRQLPYKPHRHHRGLPLCRKNNVTWRVSE